MFLTVEPVGADRLGTEHLEVCLAACPLLVHAVWRCGDWEGEPGGPVNLLSGFSVRAADGPLPTFAGAVTAALAFLGRHTGELAVLSRHPSVNEVRLWVPAPVPPRDADAVRVPRRLAEVAAAAGVRVQVCGRGA